MNYLNRSKTRQLEMQQILLNKELNQLKKELYGNSQKAKNSLSEKHKLLILKSLMFGYADIVIEQTDEKNKQEFWYKQAQEVKRFFVKCKPAPVTKDERIMLDEAYQKFVKFDAEYFENKKGSPYLCMLTILDYLIFEKNDLSLKVKFGHYPFGQIRDELSTFKNIKEYYFDSSKYLTAILDKLNLN